ncbi:MAG: hypothetical protein HGA45_18140 [Chloroflexales bacterium]|nr:hypothetical protein [Chloroflexales bacterium]
MKTSRSAAGAARKRQPEPPLSPRAAPPPDEEGPLERSADAPRYHTFTVRFLVDPREVCRRTEVTYVQEGVSEAWPGYDQARLTQWIAERLQPIELSVSAPAPEPAPPLEVALLLRDLSTEATDDGEARQLVVVGQPITLRLALELSGESGHGLALPYTATAYARNFAGGSIEVGEAHGEATVGAVTAVEIAGSVGQPGIYRLGASVTLDLPVKRSEALAGGLLHVYGDR